MLERPAIDLPADRVGMIPWSYDHIDRPVALEGSLRAEGRHGRYDIEPACFKPPGQQIEDVGSPMDDQYGRTGFWQGVDHSLWAFDLVAFAAYAWMHMRRTFLLGATVAGLAGWACLACSGGAKTPVKPVPPLPGTDTKLELPAIPAKIEVTASKPTEGTSPE